MNVSQVPAGTIVVGVDGSATSDQAVLWAAEQARLENRALTLVHGVGVGSTAMLNQPGGDRAMVLEYMRQDGVTALEEARRLVEKKAPDVEVHEHLALIDPRLVLLELADEAAMVVLGSRGRGPVRSLLLGSVGLAVSQHATCPVVVLRPRKVGAVRRGVLVGVDDTENSRSTVEFAYRQASLRGLPLTVLHCFWDVLNPTTALGVVDPGEEGIDAHRMVLAEAVAGMTEKFPDVYVDLTLARGLPDDCLVRAAKQMDMVVVGSHPHHGIAGLVYGDVSRGVVEHAETVVAVVAGRSGDVTSA